ncbi:hypothetical protein VPIG_00037 [Vibrio phage PWH3a-P1]|uniref:hypothetical protein n=1 Tax=Vibrio phage PWH3a-P1 TaxID=754058 RepID=UPI0002C10909|nr:hypothetical protein VPIG_00037 [Vibrio phage PWH3a-P1]AGH31895.1 hypothetical protein VPIG_00037 [Vibrio phage PWH3a-P1]
MTEQKYDPSKVDIIIGDKVYNMTHTMGDCVMREVYSTKSLQLNSLCEYARSLGFVPRDVEMLSKGFEYIDSRSWHTNHISLSDMCKLHNLAPLMLTPNIKYILGLNNKNLDVPTMGLQFAVHKKLVHCVKLQRSKKEYDGVKCQSNMVKLTDTGKDYCAQFPRYDFLLCED